MKNAKELKKDVFSRIMCCWGELCTVFFLSVGGYSVFVLACMIAERLLRSSGVVNFYPRTTASSYVILFLVSIAALILLIVASTPLSYGIKWYRIQQIRGNSVHARSIFSLYTSIRRFGQVLRLNSMLIVRKLYAIVPAALISALGFYISGKIEVYSDGAEYYLSFFLSWFIMLYMICLLAIFNVKYAAVPYLYVLEPDKPPMEVINKSKRIMRGKTRYLAGILFSLSGWIVPCLIIFPMIFIVPYVQMVYTAAVNEIILSEREEGQDIDERRIPLQEGTS